MPDVCPASALNHRILRRSEVAELCRRRDNGDGAARNQLVEHNLRLVAKEASKYRLLTEGGLGRDDLFQEGVLGLVRAAEKYDPKQGAEFSTYARLWIRQAIGRAHDVLGTTITVPEEIAKAERKVWRERKRLTAELGRAPTDEELAQSTQFTKAFAKRLGDRAQVTASLAQPISEASCLADVLIDVAAVPVDERLAIAELRQVVAQAIDRLPSAEATALNLYYGIGPGQDEPRTYDEVGDKLGCTKRDAEEHIVKARQRLADDARLLEYVQ